MLAADLDLPVPKPLLVTISDAFIETVPNPDAAALLRQSLRVGFGSSRLPNGYSVWPDGNGVPKSMLAQAAEIFAFDALIQNPDRHPKNPNMQVKGEQLAIYDHELAFIWEGVLFWKPPWEAGGLDNMTQPDRHVFFTAIKGQVHEFSRFIGAWEAISDDRLAQYQAALPAEWNGSSDMIGKVLAFVRQLRDNIRPAMHGNAKGVDMNKQAYSYSVLRYVHDVTTGEFVNVGLALSVIPQDDSALQWAPMGSGLTSDPDATLELLFERFVMKHEETTTVHRRNDEQVWKNFSRELEQQQVLKHFLPKTFTTADDEIKFDRAWKNGVWHCLAPVSFDLASPESIREKAHKWLGQMTSVDSADLKLYFLVGEPSQADLKPVFQSALNILKKASCSAEVFTETDAASLARQLAVQVAQHEANAAHT